ncbi:NAD-dependent alcohol dehydrogenase [Siccirubricoccus deserti]|uniref:alcohol dehydrogenase n=1 Tax=Siccirubricoccus deserti TaxID=2013562 RepID=A0A9X0R0R8_9PROT|nr:alcohol dehydrogenase [Siccirubricoccus deserti]MBC4017549.1 alcohol dehydrogenase catalytic domain-containing protein [Siccirubricoccus deserti]GGC59511.1 NAD-dependent alcohol dehydrogenase [Siccirubricoccus deserti]
MRAWAVVETGKPLQELEMPTPEPTGAQVLLEVTHAGVCHSDLHIWEGEYDLGSRGKMRLTDRGVVLPLAMGHEIVGRVVKLGPDAANQGSKVGDLRVVYPWVGCGKCATCQRDEENMCLTPRSLGVYQNGGYATHVLATHVKHLIDIEGVDPALAATYACSGVTVYSAINKLMPLDPNEAIVLVGAGGLGLNAIAILKALGHRNIVVVDVDEKKLAAAKEQGATQTVLASKEGTAQRIVEAAGGPAAGVIDLVNGTETARFAFDALRKGGKLVQVGLFGGEMNIPLPLMPIRALTIQGSYVGNVKELRALIDIAKQGKIPGIPVETQPQNQADAVLNRLKNGQITGRVVLVGAAA